MSELSKEVVLKEVKAIESGLRGHNYTERQLNVLYLSLRNYRVVDLRKAVDKIIAERNCIPAVMDVVQYARLEYEHDFSRKERDGAAEFWKGRGSDALMRDSKKAIIGVLGGEFSREEYYRHLVQLHNKHPHAGFWDAAQQYRRQVIDRLGDGMPRSKPKPRAVTVCEADML